MVRGSSPSLGLTFRPDRSGRGKLGSEMEGRPIDGSWIPDPPLLSVGAGLGAFVPLN